MGWGGGRGTGYLATKTAEWEECTLQVCGGVGVGELVTWPPGQQSGKSAPYKYVVGEGTGTGYLATRTAEWEECNLQVCGGVGVGELVTWPPGQEMGKIAPYTYVVGWGRGTGYLATRIAEWEECTLQVCGGVGVGEMGIWPPGQQMGKSAPYKYVVGLGRGTGYLATRTAEWEECTLQVRGGVGVGEMVIWPPGQQMGNSAPYKYVVGWGRGTGYLATRIAEWEECTLQVCGGVGVGELVTWPPGQQMGKSAPYKYVVGWGLGNWLPGHQDSRWGRVRPTSMWWGGGWGTGYLATRTADGEECALQVCGGVGVGELVTWPPGQQMGKSAPYKYVVGGGRGIGYLVTRTAEWEECALQVCDGVGVGELVTWPPGQQMGKSAPYKYGVGWGKGTGYLATRIAELEECTLQVCGGVGVGELVTWPPGQQMGKSAPYKYVVGWG